MSKEQVFLILNELKKKSKKLSDEEINLIATCAEAAIYYSSIINKRFLQGEKAIFNSLKGIDYFEKFKFIPEEYKESFEDLISKDSFSSYKYAAINNAPFEKGETAIAKDCYYSYLYSKEILKSRFYLCEGLFSKNVSAGVFYAVDVLKKRFEIIEPFVADTDLRNLYTKVFKVVLKPNLLPIDKQYNDTVINIIIDRFNHE